MKKENYYLINSILCGLSAILWSIYEGLVNLASLAVMYTTNRLNETNLADNVRSLSFLHIKYEVFIIVAFIVVLIVNHFLIKKDKKNLLIVLTIIILLSLIYIIYKNIALFIS